MRILPHLLLFSAFLTFPTLVSSAAGSEEEVFEHTTEPTIEQLLTVAKSLKYDPKKPFTPQDVKQMTCDAANIRSALMHFYIKPDVNKAALGWSQERQFKWYAGKFKETPNTQMPWDVPDATLRTEEFGYRILSYNTMTYCDKDVVEQISGFKVPKEVIGTPQDLPLLPGEFTVEAWNLVNDFLYWIAVNPKQKGIIVSFRGTVSTNDWIVNMQSWFGPVDPQVFPRAPAGATVRHGQQALTQKLVFDKEKGLLVELVKLHKKYPTFSIVFSGHSLGGGLAMTSFLAVALQRPEWPMRAVYSIGGPIVGNAIFSDWLSNTVGATRVIRIVSSDDTVPFAADNTWRDDVTPETAIRHAKNSPVMFYPEPYKRALRICIGPEDKNCNRYPCENRHWEHHSWYGGFWMGERYCLMSKKPQVRGI